MARSINQNAYAGALPNFRNLGIMLRVLLIVNVAAVAAAIVKSPGLLAAWRQFIESSALVEPQLILSLLVLAALSNALRRIPYWVAAMVVLAVELALATALYYLVGHLLLGDESSSLERYWALVALTTVALLVYFNLRERALSPALSEARLQALQARIRPHFLFNSINAVLSLIRKEPQRAEATLEDMADLFRVLMADNRELSSLAREIELCRQYLGIEQLRLGERLQVDWQLDALPPDALVPPLVLQPLLENAVYHGIEPRSEPGTISIRVYAVRDELHAVLRNPYSRARDHHAGNRMALANIRERLALHFDAEARLSVKASEDAYEVRIVMPYVKGGDS